MQPQFYTRVYSTTDILQFSSWFQQMRTHHPVFYDEPSQQWQVFRYRDVVAVLTDTAHFSSQHNTQAGSFFEGTVIAKDPPEHRHMRNLVNLAFTPRAIGRLTQTITSITQDLLEPILPLGHMNAVSDLAVPLPARVIAALLGVPAQDWDILQRWAQTEHLTSQQRPTSPQASQQFLQNLQQEMFAYFAALLKERRRTPGEDILSLLSQAEVDGERLSEDALLRFCVLLLGAGQETTRNLIATFLWCVTEDPALLQRLIREPEMVPAAIEEVLRYLPPIWSLSRRTTTEVELAGQRIPAHQTVQAWISSANRDPEYFSRPDQFDIQRSPNRHLAFGHGIHFCLGAPLARLETQIALPLLLSQLKGLQRVRNDEPITATLAPLLTITRLPLSFQPSSGQNQL
ncbi:cytochrome P450 [Ktedonosporobacter rubrisoli]|uniref:Cytochrome P450 n=1 Tax=Ktedonosporobacter rubrisoli TaxID=2509675 RepID=A0A4P6JPS9_KTERU|nr:cytochrome P450 [Ktedonosporobacter rubrisoli]QBD77397.1 cytochrome P450 [Ktedonosporobacter rubrisoli]